MAYPDRARPIVRRLRRRRALPVTGGQNAQPAAFLERVLSVSVIDRLLERAVGHPRLLQWVGISLGLVIIALPLRPFFVSSAGSASAAGLAQASNRTTLSLSTADRDSQQRILSAEPSEPLAVVGAYNQASIAAALLGRADVIAPYLASDGAAWTEVLAEFARRATRAETHEPTLTRWGVLREEITGDTAKIETQEQWDDITRVGGHIVSSRRGVLTQNTYELRRAATGGRWQISTVTSVSVIG